MAHPALAPSGHSNDPKKRVCYTEITPGSNGDFCHRPSSPPTQIVAAVVAFGDAAVAA